MAHSWLAASRGPAWCRRTYARSSSVQNQALKGSAWSAGRAWKRTMRDVRVIMAQTWMWFSESSPASDARAASACQLPAALMSTVSLRASQARCEASTSAAGSRSRRPVLAAAAAAAAGARAPRSEVLATSALLAVAAPLGLPSRVVATELACAPAGGCRCWCWCCAGCCACCCSCCGVAGAACWRAPPPRACCCCCCRRCTGPSSADWLVLAGWSVLGAPLRPSPSCGCAGAVPGAATVGARTLLAACRAWAATALLLPPLAAAALLLGVSLDTTTQSELEGAHAEWEA
jgi:hypothetical protein